MKKIHSVWVVGAGGIGSRHLQALKGVNLPLEITAIDPSAQSLKIAKERYDSMPAGHFNHKIDYQTEIPKKSEAVDLAIIATCSDIRIKVITELLRSAGIKYLVLEKILFNKKSDYDFIKKMLQRLDVKAWVNCPMRMMPPYQKIEKYFGDKKISYIVTGSKFGLITTAIHYLDHASYLSGTTKFKIDTAGLDPLPIPSKRKGFLEFNGTLTANFKNGGNLSLTCYSEGNCPIVVEIHGSSAKYLGRESEGKAWLARADNNWRWEELEALIPPQSQLTTAITENILKNGKCELTTYKESVKIHLQMLEPLLKFLNKNGKKKFTHYPFT